MKLPVNPHQFHIKSIVNPEIYKGTSSLLFTPSRIWNGQSGRRVTGLIFEPVSCWKAGLVWGESEHVDA